MKNPKGKKARKVLGVNELDASQVQVKLEGARAPQAIQLAGSRRLDSRQVGRLAHSLHKAGAINLDMKLSEVLEVEGLGEMDPNSPVGITAVAWSGYAVVLANQNPTELIETQHKLVSVEKELKNLTKQVNLREDKLTNKIRKK